MRVPSAIRGAFASCRQLIDQVGLQLGLSIWLAVVFAERLVVDLRVWAYGREASWASVVVDVSVGTLLMLGLPLLVVALLAQRRLLDRLEARLQSLTGTLRKRATKVTSYLFIPVAGFLLYLVPELDECVSFGTAALGFLAYLSRFDTWSHLLTSRPSLAVYTLVALALSGVLYWLVVGVTRQLRERLPERVVDAYREWAFANVFLVLVIGLYLGIYLLSIDKFDVLLDLATAYGGEMQRSFFWLGLLKDTAIYGLVAAGLVSGTLRWRLCARALTQRGRWHFMGVLWGGTAIIATVALTLDMLYAQGIHDASSHFASEYPRLWQRRIVYWHIWLRDWLLLLPLVAAVCIWSVWVTIKAGEPSPADDG